MNQYVTGAMIRRLREERKMTQSDLAAKLCVSVRHDMNKEHYVSFIAAVMDNGYEIVKLYPEGAAEARFKISRTRKIYCYCNRHGLFEATPPRRARK